MGSHVIEDYVRTYVEPERGPAHRARDAGPVRAHAHNICWKLPGTISGSFMNNVKILGREPNLT